MTPFTTDPASIAVEDASISADIRHTPDGWETVVVVSRATGLPALHSADLDAQLYGPEGEALEKRAAPSGQLVEVGGGLGRSANARFQFAEASVEPTRLVVAYSGRTVVFRLIKPG